MELERSVIGNDIRLQGDIRLTAPPPVTEYVLLPMLEQFQKDYPLITIELNSTYGQADLSRRDADLAIRFSDKPDDYLVGRRLPEFRETVFASPAYITQHWDGDTPIYASRSSYRRSRRHASLQRWHAGSTRYGTGFGQSRRRARRRRQHACRGIRPDGRSVSS